MIRDMKPRAAPANSGSRFAAKRGESRGSARLRRILRAHKGSSKNPPLGFPSDTGWPKATHERGLRRQSLVSSLIQARMVSGKTQARGVAKPCHIRHIHTITGVGRVRPCATSGRGQRTTIEGSRPSGRSRYQGTIREVRSSEHT